MGWVKIGYPDDSELIEKTCGYEFQLHVPGLDYILVVHQISEDHHKIKARKKGKWTFFIQGWVLEAGEAGVFNTPKPARTAAVAALKVKLDEVMTVLSEAGTTRVAKPGDLIHGVFA